MKLAVCALLGLLAAACAARPASAPRSLEPASEVAETHRARCGACHVHVEPGERSRAELDLALARHRKRVRLTETEWAALVDYLAAAPQTSKIP